MGEDVVAGGDVVAVCAAVVAGVGLGLGNEVIFVLRDDRLAAALASCTYGHGASCGGFD